MKTASELKIYPSNGYEYIYIYYKQKIGSIRINTKYTAVKNGMTKENLFKKSVKDFEEKNKHIMTLKGRADSYISNKLLSNSTTSVLNQKEAYNIVFNLSQPDTELDENKLLLPVFDKYVENLNEEHSYQPSTLKYYKNLKNHIKAFGKTLPGQCIYLSSLNSKKSLINFCKHLGEKKNMNDNSTRKRLNSVISFLKYCSNEGIYDYDSSIYSVKIKKYDLNVVALDKSEIQQLINLKIENPTWQRLIDVFILNCFLGLRISDLRRTNEGAFIQDEDKDYYYTSTNQKTGTTIKIPITEIPLSILKKFEFKIPKYTGQYFNRELQEILKYYKLFESEVIIRRKVLKTDKDVKVLKRSIITSRTCRKSFITNCISSSIPLNAIMKASGHKQIQTLQAYVEKASDKGQFKKLNENIKKKRIIQEKIDYSKIPGDKISKGEIL